MKEEKSRGSEWIKCDLHLHTPDTKLNKEGFEITEEDKWDKYCDLIEQSDVIIFGITDYFSIDNYFKFLEKFNLKYPNSKKVFFPNIEFRLDVSVNRKGEEVNIHLQKVAATTYLLKGEHNEANEIIRGYPAELGHSTSHNQFCF